MNVTVLREVYYIRNVVRNVREIKQMYLNAYYGTSEDV